MNSQNVNAYSHRVSNQARFPIQSQQTYRHSETLQHTNTSYKNIITCVRGDDGTCKVHGQVCLMANLWTMSNSEFGNHVLEMTMMR